MAKLKIIVEVDFGSNYDAVEIAEEVVEGEWENESKILQAEWIEDWRVGGRPEGKLPPPMPPEVQHKMQEMLAESAWDFRPGRRPPLAYSPVPPSPPAPPEHDGTPYVAGLLRQVLGHLGAGTHLAREIERTVREEGW